MKVLSKDSNSIGTGTLQEDRSIVTAQHVVDPNYSEDGTSDQSGTGVGSNGNVTLEFYNATTGEELGSSAGEAAWTQGDSSDAAVIEPDSDLAGIASTPTFEDSEITDPQALVGQTVEITGGFDEGELQETRTGRITGVSDTDGDGDLDVEISPENGAEFNKGLSGDNIQLADGTPLGVVSTGTVEGDGSIGNITLEMNSQQLDSSLAQAKGHLGVVA